MTPKPVDLTDEALDPLRSMVVETVHRPDGRYVIYYSWPEPPTDDSRAESDESGAGPQCDV